MDLATARSRRTALITRINGYIDWTASAEMRNDDFCAIKTRMDRFNDSFTLLETANAIVAGAADDDQAAAALWTEFYEVEDRFTNAQIVMQRRFVELTPAVAVAGAMDGNAGAADGQAAVQPAGQPQVVQLAFQPQNIQQTWGKFNGNPLEWHDFRSRFELACHSRPEIPPEYKFGYLRNALVGPAAQASKGWILSPENYQKAWDELVAKYSKRYPLACAYLTRFFALEKLGTVVFSADLQRMSDATNELMRQLRGMDYPVDDWNLIIVHALQERLNDHYADKWDTARADNDEPTVEDMTKFLDRHASKVASKTLARASLQVSVPNEYARRPSVQSVVQRPPAASTSGHQQRYPCGSCGSFQHLIYVCPEFKPLSLAERKKVVKNMGMCPNCLKRGHAKQDCYDSNVCRLKECASDNKHNSMLCPTKNQTQYVTLARDDVSSSSSNDGQGRAYRAGHGRGGALAFRKRHGDGAA